MCEKKILFGYSRKDVTPDFPVSLTGYGDDDRRISEGVLMPIAADCLTFTDNDNHTVILYTADLLYPAHPLLVNVRQAVSKKTGVPEEIGASFRMRRVEFSRIRPRVTPLRITPALLLFSQQSKSVTSRRLDSAV